MKKLIKQTGTIKTTPEINQRAVDCLCNGMLIMATKFGNEGIFLQKEYKRQGLSGIETAAVLEGAAQLAVRIVKQIQQEVTK